MVGHQSAEGGRVLRLMIVAAGVIGLVAVALGVRWLMVRGGENGNLKQIDGRGAETEEVAPTQRAASIPDQVAEREQPSADARLEVGAVTVEVFASHLRPVRGRTFRVAIALDIDEGWHVYAENPEIDYLVPTRVDMVATEAFEPVALNPPPHVRKLDPALDQPVNSWEGRVWFLQTVRVADDAEPGERNLSFRVRTQACDGKRCLPPRTDTISLDLTVVGDASKADPTRHEAVFARFEKTEPNGP